MYVLMLICCVSVASAQYSYGLSVNSNGALSSREPYVPPVSSQVEGAEYNKAFYTYSAPEEEFEDVNTNEQISNVWKRNLRVILIKGPENTALENAVVQLAKGAADDRTAIYVLSKQSDIGSLASQVQQHVANNLAKPEVHFVKYRTQADAENAQRAIQAQYDGLRGSTSSSSSTATSVLNFVSKSASPSAINSAFAHTVAAAPTAAPTRSFIPARNAYLPPSKRY